MYYVRQSFRFFFLALGFTLFVVMAYISFNKADDIKVVTGKPHTLSTGPTLSLAGVQNAYVTPSYSAAASIIQPAAHEMASVATVSTTSKISDKSHTAGQPQSTTPDTPSSPLEKVKSNSPEDIKAQTDKTAMTKKDN